jgi:hypothetical protein
MTDYYKLAVFLLIIFILFWIIWFNPILVGSGSENIED